MNTSNADANDLGELVEERGAWPFASYRLYRATDRSTVAWHSRTHRKDLPAAEARLEGNLVAWLLAALVNANRLNWWIAVGFAVGACLFILGSVLTLAPGLDWLSPIAVGAIFFAGSIPFTTAAFLQLFQAANAEGQHPGSPPQFRPRALLRWHAGSIGWLSCALQFVGTILFNFNTLDAMWPSSDWRFQDLAVWTPNVLGSALFLASGYLAFAEVCHGYGALRLSSVSWWATVLNLLGCVAFMLSALYAFIPPDGASNDALELSVAYTLIGGIGFLLGSLLMLLETTDQPKT